MTYTYTVTRASTPVKSLRRKYLLYCYWREMAKVQILLVPRKKIAHALRGNDVRKSDVMEVSATQLVYANDTRPFPSPAHQQRR